MDDRNVWNEPLPRSEDSEFSVIGSVLLVPECLDLCFRILRGKHFYNVSLGRVYDSMVGMRQRSDGIDAVTVLVRVCHDWPEETEEACQALLLRSLESVPYAAHAEFYARTIVECWKKRELIVWSTGLAERTFNPTADSSELIGEATKKLQDIVDEGCDENTTVAQEFEMLLSEIKTERKTGIPTGFVDLDNKTFGMPEASLIILAARSGSGKTALCCNIILNAASAGKRVLFISLEQSKRELIARFASMRAKVDSSRLRQGQLDEREMWEIEKAAREVSSFPIQIVDTPSQTIIDIAAAARMAKARDGLDLVVVDYLQFVKPLEMRISREQQVASISREMKNMAKQLNVPVLVLCQMSREIEKREDKRPKMSDLRESGAIEQDADMIWFINRPGAWDKEADQSEASLIIAKHRNGSCGEVPLRWDGSYMLFQNAALSGQSDYGGFHSCGFQSWDPFVEDVKGDF